MLTQAYIADKRKDRAEDTYMTIFEEVEPDSPLQVQMYMNYGSYALGNSKKRKAEQAFEKAAEIAQNIGEPAMAIECYRIIGTLNDSVLTKDKMIRYFEKCLDIAKLMEPSAREQSSIRFVASMLILTYEADTDKKNKLDGEMKSYFGDDWKVSVERPKAG